MTGQSAQRVDSDRGRFTGKVAAVTGAGSGIGRQLAYGLARRGARLALADLDEATLTQTAARARAMGAQVTTMRLDVADRAAVAAYAQATREHFGVVHQIYNSAGIGSGGRTILDIPYAELERVLAVNLWGVIHGTKEFLPHLLDSGDGQVVNISSLNGFLAQPGMSAYCTAKFAVRGFAEVLRAEVARDRLPVRITVVHPGGVRTGIATATLARARENGEPVSAHDEENVRFYNEKLLRMDPAEAASIILDGVAAGRTRVLVGADARAVDALVRLVPARAPRLAAWLERRVRPE